MSTGMNPAGAQALPPLFQQPTAHTAPASPDATAPGGGNGPASSFQRQFEEAGAAQPPAQLQPTAMDPAAAGAQDPGGNVFQLQDGRLLSPVTGTSREAQTPALFAAEGEALRGLPGRWETFREKIHSRLSSGAEISNEEMVLMQLELNEISFQVETASKVVEHATSGTKTVLQTQA